jgi:hypothetical protein
MVLRCVERTLGSGQVPDARIPKVHTLETRYVPWSQAAGFLLTG